MLEEFIAKIGRTQHLQNDSHDWTILNIPALYGQNSSFKTCLWLNNFEHTSIIRSKLLFQNMLESFITLALISVLTSTLQQQLGVRLILSEVSSNIMHVFPLQILTIWGYDSHNELTPMIGFNPLFCRNTRPCIRREFRQHVNQAISSLIETNFDRSASLLRHSHHLIDFLNLKFLSFVLFYFFFIRFD